ncbi:unnamed protein product [Miscanthus lutarioriparius]|uniref:Phosphoribulokinase/uridine kinase domain-containing protein n=1 Tax=Miscanthus lutarioriparius TaxID=422564 RepID=A0A811RAX9_9POAL|nr:unnamed protein product [Miscanthus lutarioriparius]
MIPAVPAGFVTCRSYATRSKLVRAMPPVLGSFRPASPHYPSFQDTNSKKTKCSLISETTNPADRSQACFGPSSLKTEGLYCNWLIFSTLIIIHRCLYYWIIVILIKIDVTFEGQWKRYIVGLAGPPGAGKSTVASEVVRRVNMLWSQKHAKGSGALLPTEEIAAMLPMDGFHLYRAQLDAMEDPKEAHARRGAPWTFDPALFLKCLQTLRTEGSVYAPSFDHGVGDPVENDIFVKPQHKIVIVEGNYLLLEEDVWTEIRDLFDEKWFIDIDIDVSMQRVLKRHIAIGKDPDVAAWRVILLPNPVFPNNTQEQRMHVYAYMNSDKTTLWFLPRTILYF